MIATFPDIWFRKPAEFFSHKIKTNLTFLVMWNEFKRNRDVKNVKSEDKSGQSWCFLCYSLVLGVLGPYRTIEGLLIRVLSISSVVHLWWFKKWSKLIWTRTWTRTVFERKYGVWSGIRRAYKRYAMASSASYFGHFPDIDRFWKCQKLRVFLL